ncbi:protein kinase [Streptomyces sp. HSW2009]|uniref:protein kinase n=1 Tax=Streptomyces sp. HSW2009 TaxID=3142890 RepID=UPI0032EB6E85
MSDGRIARWGGVVDDYAGRVLADRYRLPLPPADEYEFVETRAFDTYSGQEVLVRQVPLPEVVDAEVVTDGASYAAAGAGHGGYGGQPAYGGPGGGHDQWYGAGPGDGLTDPAVRRAIDAATAAAQVPDHPSLDQVFHVFAEAGSLWIVSELVPARPLAALLAERPLSPHRAAEVAADVLTALRALHAHGWTHRNITTRTVLVCDDGRAMLTGLAVGAAEEALCGYDPVPTALRAPRPRRPLDDTEFGPGDAAQRGQRRAASDERGAPEGRTDHGAVPSARPGAPHTGGVLPAGRDQRAPFAAEPRDAAPDDFDASDVPDAPEVPDAPRALDAFGAVRAAHAEGAGNGADAAAGAATASAPGPGPARALPGGDPSRPPAATPVVRRGPAGPVYREGAAAAEGPAPADGSADGSTGGRAGAAEPERTPTRAPRAGAIAAYRAAQAAARAAIEDTDPAPGTGPHGDDRAREHAPTHDVRDPRAAHGETPDPHEAYDPYGDGHDGARGAGPGTSAAEAAGPGAYAGGGYPAPDEDGTEYDGIDGIEGADGADGSDGTEYDDAAYDDMAYDGPGAGESAYGVPDGDGYRGPDSALAAERARQARIVVVGAVTERWAPEQAGPVYENWRLAPPVGPAADLWAVGVLLFRAVQGHAPYPEDNAAELVQLVCAEPPAYAEECGALRPVVESLMRQDPTERPDFEELRGWLRSLIRSAPEPDVGSRTVPVPPSDPGEPADPKRLPILRRRGELVRRRRAAAALHGRHRHKKGRPPRVPEQRQAPQETAPRQEKHLRLETHESAPPREPSTRAPRSLGRLLLLFILLLLAAGVLYAMVFLPDGEKDDDADRGAGSSTHSGAPPVTGSGKNGDAPPIGQQPQSTDPAGLAKGFTLRKDPGGFQLAVAERWQRRAPNGRGQIRYLGDDYEMIVVPGRDKTAEYGTDPMKYQQDLEPELAPYRDSDWASASGLRRIDVGQTAMAEGAFGWKDTSGRQVYVRNLAMIISGRYHVVQIIGPAHARNAVDRYFDQAAASYRATG